MNMTRSGLSTDALSAKSRPIDTAHSAFSEASGLCERVKALADRLVGPVPVGASELPNSSDGSVFGMLEDGARTTLTQVTEAHIALERIEAALL